MFAQLTEEDFELECLLARMDPAFADEMHERCDAMSVEEAEELADGATIRPFDAD